MKKLVFRLLPLLLAVLLLQCKGDHKVVNNQIVVSGRIVGLHDTTLTFTYTPFAFLEAQKELSFLVDKEGDFQLEFSEQVPLKGFLALGTVPRTYRFTFTTVSGQDSSSVVSSVDHRMVWLYLEPGDSLSLAVHADSITESLNFTGPGRVNNEFVNAEDKKFNDYRSKFLGNFYYLAYLGPDDYKRVIDGIRDEKISFLKESSQQKGFSPFLETLTREHYYAAALRSKLYYPDGHAGFNEGIFPELPADYFLFLDDFVVAGNISALGTSYLSTLSDLMKKRFEFLPDDQRDQKSLYSFVLSQLPEIDGYYVLAHMLGSDFNRELYSFFGPECPYPDLSQKVKNTYSYLEGMLPGSKIPDVVMENQEGDTVRLSNFKGHYLYLDFWATWCKPCIAELPDLKSLKERYADENILFISISVDQPADKQKWRDFLVERELDGIQLYVDREAWLPLRKAWNIRSIPRFVLIDPDGKMVDAQAARPSNPEIDGILDDLLFIRE